MTETERRERIQAAMDGFYAAQRAKGAEHLADMRKEAEREARPKRQTTAKQYLSEWDEMALVCAYLRARNLRHAANQEGLKWSGSEQERFRRLAGLKNRGFQVGRNDLEIFTRVPNRPEIRGVMLELKSMRPAAKATPEQLAWLEGLREDGYETAVIKGHAAAIAWVETLYNAPGATQTVGG